MIETSKLPPDVRAVVETLLTASTWTGDEHFERDVKDIAEQVARNWGDSASCPVCQETWCDSGCPLKPRRDAKMVEEMFNQVSGDRCLAAAEVLSQFAKAKGEVAKLRALEAYGVDNWDGYDEAIQSLDNPGVIS